MTDPDLPAAGPPLPGRPIMSQWWRDIAFLHWRVDPDRVAPLLPPGTRPDLFDGSAWVGLIPFRMVHAGIGRGPRVPWLGDFLETNVRLYSVDDHGRHGVVFRSLEAQRLGVVAGARVGFAVPYQWARMTVRAQTGPDAVSALTYESRRLTDRTARSRIGFEVGDPIGQPTALDRFLVARFGLHTRAFGRTRWVPNTHDAWPLQQARITELDDTLVAAAGLPGVVASGPPDSVLFSRGVRTTFGLPTSLSVTARPVGGVSAGRRREPRGR